MADFSALKAAIQAVIKQNGNQEITGPILQEVLLSMVNTMGDGAINSLASALSTETTNRQNADGTLQTNINNEATARQNADSGLQTAINSINTRLAEGYVYVGIATAATNPGTPAGKVFYIALQAGTYTNFSSLAVTQGISILKYNGTAWSQDQLVGIDDVPTKESNKLVKSGGVFANIGAFDISEYHKSGNTLATYADLTAALAALPSDFQKGGISVKYVQTSDNKYVQYRLMADTFNTNVANWQGVDEKPIVGSKNLVKSGGTVEYFYPFITDIYGFWGANDIVVQTKVFFAKDDSREKPTFIAGIKFKHLENSTIRFWKVSVNEGIATLLPISEDLYFSTTGEDVLFTNIQLEANEYIGVNGTFYYLGSGAPSTSGFAAVDQESGQVGNFSRGQALGIQLMEYIHNINTKNISQNASDISQNASDISQNASDIYQNRQLQIKGHINTILDLQNLEHMNWDSYTSYTTDDSIFVNLLRHSGQKITDIYYKTNGGTTDFLLVTEADGVWTSIEEIQSNTEESKDSPFIAHCKLTTPVVLGKGQFLAVRRNIYYSLNIDDKSFNSVRIGQTVIYQQNIEIAYLVIDETLEGKSLIKDTAIELLTPDDFIKNIGHTFEDGHITNSSVFRNTGFVDVSSFYRIVASFQTQGIGTTYGPAIILYDNHFNVIKTYSAFSYTRNSLFDIFISKNVKYMLINSYYNINDADYTTYTCYAYKRIKIDRNQNVLYRRTFNSSVVCPEYTNTTESNFTSNGLLINSGTPTRLNKLYSLQTRTLRLLIKFNENTIFKVSSDSGDSYVTINTSNATMTMHATTPQSVIITDFSEDYTYLLEITRNYAKNIASITNINKGTIYKVEHIENGRGGSGPGAIGTGETAGLWRDYYEFSCEIGSTLIKEINISPLYGKIKTLLYGDSITELLYYPMADYQNSWVQQFISLCADRVMVSPRGGTSIATIFTRIPNELPYIDTEYVMVTIGTNGGVTYENLSQLMEIIFKYGAIPVLNHIPCNILSGGESNHASVNTIIDRVRERYGIYGVNFDIATSVSLNGVSVDTNKMWQDGQDGNIYVHPNVLGSNAMISQLKQDMPELLI